MFSPALSKLRGGSSFTWARGAGWGGTREGDQDTDTINNAGHVSGEPLQEPLFLPGSKVWKSFIVLLQTCRLVTQKRFTESGAPPSAPLRTPCPLPGLGWGGVGAESLLSGGWSGVGGAGSAVWGLLDGVGRAGKPPPLSPSPHSKQPHCLAGGGGGDPFAPRVPSGISARRVPSPQFPILLAIQSLEFQFPGSPFPSPGSQGEGRRWRLPARCGLGGGGAR